MKNGRVITRKDILTVKPTGILLQTKDNPIIYEITLNQGDKLALILALLESYHSEHEKINRAFEVG